MIVETFSANVEVMTSGVVDASVSWRVWFWLAVHYVLALTRTISFWWIGRLAKSKVTVFDVSPLNSITFYEYSNEPTETPVVDWVIELYPTLESKEDPISVVLSTVIKYWALLVGVGVHVEADTPAANGV